MKNINQAAWPHFLQRAAQEGAIAGLIGMDSLPQSATTLLHGSPIDQTPLPGVSSLPVSEYDKMVRQLAAAFSVFRTVPAPRRGLLIKAFAAKVAEHKEELAELITLEVGKIRSEARGEVQEVIDICDFALGFVTPATWPDHRQ